MSEIDIASLKERLWQKMQGDLAQFIPEVIDRNRLMCCACGRFLPLEDCSARLGQPLNHRSRRHCPEAPSWSRAEVLRRVMTRLARGPRAPPNRGRPWTLAPRDR